MTKNKKIFFVISIVLITVAVYTTIYCQNSTQEENIKRVMGQVVDIDWVGGKLVIRTERLDSPPDEMTFIVTRDTEITKGASNITFADINLSDDVTVEYSHNSFVGLQAVRIIVQE